MALSATEKLGTVIPGAVTDADGRLIVAGPGGTGVGGGLPANATPIDTSGNGAAGAISASIPAVTNKTSYLTGFEITGSGATAGSVIDVTVTGPTNTLHYEVTVPAGAGVGITPLLIEFGRPIPASAVNTAVTVNVPSFGAGNTNAAVVAHGYQL